MNRLSIIVVFIVIGAQGLLAQNVKWHTFEEAVALNAKEPRNIMIDIYTDWCGWCKVMDRETFSQPAIAKILNEQYYAVKLNAETKDTITFQGTAFVNDGEGARPPHQLAVAMLKGKMSYPNIVFLNKENQMLGAVPGFRKEPEMNALLSYISQELYRQNIDLGQYLEESKKKTTE